jgi:hypothetical protein
MEHIKDIKKVRFCVVSGVEDGAQVLGDYDMTDWDKTWDEQVWVDAQKTGLELETATVMRIDQAMDLWLDLQAMLELDGTYNLKDYYA